jgi:hypothetical protein
MAAGGARGGECRRPAERDDGAAPPLARDAAFDRIAGSAADAVPRQNMLGHLRPAVQYAIRHLATEQRGEATMHRYLVSAGAYRGSEVAVHLQLCLHDAADPRVVLSIPGGGGSFPEETVWWLTRRFRENHAAVDWVGRGRSPDHPHLGCDYDPMYMPEDRIEDAFLFHNLAAIWAALDWLFHIGYRPDAVVGGSWGGVFAFLLAALDRRIDRIFPTFGCGGMSFPGVEKRSMWDAAIDAMGPRRTALWRAAFDPLLRLGDLAAGVYYETATNDKFFSIPMAMETVRRVPKLHFLSIVANQDHTMRPFGVQPYIVQNLPPARLRGCVATSGVRLRWEAGAAAVAAAPLPGDGRDIRLMWSEQHRAHGDMSREWFALAAADAGDGGTRFRLRPTAGDASLLFFLNRPVALDGDTVINSSTPIYRTAAPAARSAGTEPDRLLLSAPDAELWSAPVGDKSHPPVTAEKAGWRVRFSAVPLARIARFGVRPWLLPRGWRSIEVALAEPVGAAASGLSLFLSRRYQHNDEEAVCQAFAEAAAQRRPGQRVYRFSRARFTPAIVVEQRFRRHDLPSVAAVLDDFDAVGIIDLEGPVAGDIVLVSIRISDDSSGQPRALHPMQP